MTGISMRAGGLLLAVVLWTAVVPLCAAQEALPAGEEMAADAAPDPLVLERDALREKASGFSMTAQSFGERQNALRLELKEAAQANRSLTDVVTEDEETAALTLRLQQLEVELQEVREALKARIHNNPEVQVRQERVKAISEAMQVLRSEREAFEKAATATLRRLKVVEDELAKRERAAAAAAAAGEGETSSGETNGVRSVSEKIPGTGASK